MRRGPPVLHDGGMRFLRGLVLVVFVGAAACSRRSGPPKNVLLVSLDTVRADRLGCYGRADAGTPRLDGLSKDGVRFDDASTTYPMTLPAHASLFTGRLPGRHGVRHNGLFALAPEADTLAEALGARGLRTGGFVASVALARRHGLAQGFEQWSEPGSEGGQLFLLADRTASQVNADALRWIDSLKGSPFFAFVHYMEAHYPYQAPEPEKTRFAKDPYQGEVAFLDRALGELLDSLEQRELLRDTLVIVVSDHGEDLGDHGEGTHGLFVYQSTVRVVMLVSGPGARRGGVVDAPVSLTDVMPTVLEALGAAPAPAGDGESLWPAVAGRGDAASDRSIYAETFLPRLDFGWSELRAVRSGGLKYIQAPRPELYDVRADPGEKQDLSVPRAADVPLLKRRLEEVVARTETGGGAERVELSAQEREALASLGYVGGEGGTGGPALDDPKDRYRDAVRLDEARWNMRNGRPAEGERILREMIAGSPRFVDAHLSLIIACLMQGKDAEAVAAEAALESALAGVPDEARLLARAHVIMAEHYGRAGDIERAVAEYRASLAAPQPPELHVLLARMLRDLGRPAEARDVLHALQERGEITADARAMLQELATP